MQFQSRLAIALFLVGGLSGCPETPLGSSMGSQPLDPDSSGQGISCDAMALAGLEISFVSSHGADRFRVIAQDGSYREELHTYPRSQETDPHVYSGAFERPGTYDIKVYFLNLGTETLLYQATAVVQPSQGPCHRIESTVKVEF